MTSAGSEGKIESNKIKLHQGKSGVNVPPPTQEVFYYEGGVALAQVAQRSFLWLAFFPHFQMTILHLESKGSLGRKGTGNWYKSEWPIVCSHYWIK